MGVTPKEFNEWRIVPRVLIIAEYLFCGFAWVWVVRWFMAYPWATIESEVVALAIAGFPAVVLGALTTSLASLTNNYFKTGGNGP